MLDRPRASVARAVRNRIAGKDFEEVHARIWYAPGERWFVEADPIWQVHADTSMFIGGIRALLLQSLHPVAMWGVHEHSGYRGDPWGRLQRISHFLAFTTYGPVDAAEQRIDRLNRIHASISGVAPDGRPYRADDPQLLAWVHAAEVDSFLSAHQAFGRRPLTAEGCDTYVAQSALVAGKLGVLEPPRTVAELDAVLTSYRSQLRWTAQAQEAADLLISDPPLPRLARPAYAPLVGAAVALLPSWARTELRLPSTPIADRLLSRPLAAAVTGLIRWALSGTGPQGGAV
nr:oxygenase MpaB family protein [Microlunatus panaciterrae]